MTTTPSQTEESAGVLIAAVGLAATLLPLNSTMIVVALPDIAADVGGVAAGAVLSLAVTGPQGFGPRCVPHF
jgi:hypothetical protein